MNRKIQLVEEAIRLTEERLAVSSDYPVLKSVKAQPDFVLSAFRDDRRPTATEKDTITLRVLAVREFEATDPEYADILERVSYLYKRPEIHEV